MKTKIVTIIMLSIVILLSFTVKAQATTKYIRLENKVIKISEVNLDKINPDDWNTTKYQKESTELNNTVGKVLGIIRNVGIIVSVIALMIIGMRTMYGSLEDKSHYKEVLPSFLIGVFILLSCTTIPDIIYRAFK